jgi:peptidoglycan/LPS O-acetylase OafA/YrhL
MGIENFLAASFALLVLWTIPHFQSKITNFFGQISYSLYLIHTITGGAVVNILSHRVTGVWGKFGVIVLGVAFATLCAYLFYRWIEKPAQKWSQRLQYQNKKGTLSQ